MFLLRKIISLKKAFAFTLAETLIVMGIIGVVAALTIPNLNSSTGEKEKVAKVKKIYSNLEDALGRATAVYGPFDEWFNGLSIGEAQTIRVAERLTEFMKISKDYGYNSGGYSIITADGTKIVISSPNYIEIDIDGPNKGKNYPGYDKFYFYIADNGIVPNGRDERTSPLTSCRGGGWGGSYCADWVIEMGNMDYLKADNQGKCPNGKVLDWTTNTSCK